MLQRESLPFSVETLKRLLSEHKLRMLPSKLPEGAKGNALVPPPLQLLADSIEQLRQKLIAADPVQIPGLHDGTMARAAETLAKGLPRIPHREPQQSARLEAARIALWDVRPDLDPPPLTSMPAERIDIHDRLSTSTPQSV